MYRYDKYYISKRAVEMGFIKDTLEKVYRLADILEYINTNILLKDKLALKGGTAINLLIFNLPRLSVDIDLDYMINESKELMFKSREKINSIISGFMNSEGYILSHKTKNTHSLDSLIYNYINLSGNTDNIKIEINYSMRAHIFPSRQMRMTARYFGIEYDINSLNSLEIFGSKITALLNRRAARDLYDIYNMVKFDIFSKRELDLLRKCVVFYWVVSAKNSLEYFNYEVIDKISPYKIRTALLPVITKQDKFDLEIAKKSVKNFLNQLMVLTQEEQEFLNKFVNRQFIPELLFENSEIIDRIKFHPMALWKIN